MMKIVFVIEPFELWGSSLHFWWVVCRSFRGLKVSNLFSKTKLISKMEEIGIILMGNARRLREETERKLINVRKKISARG